MSAASRDNFDPALLRAALNAERCRRDLSWRALARQAGVVPGIGTLLAAGRHPSVGVLLALLGWLGDTDVAPYVRRAGSGGALDTGRQPPPNGQPAPARPRIPAA